MWVSGWVGVYECVWRSAWQKGHELNCMKSVCEVIMNSNSFVVVFRCVCFVFVFLNNECFCMSVYDELLSGKGSTIFL